MHITKYSTVFVLGLLILTPVLAFAQNEFGEVGSLLNDFIVFINNTLVPLVFGLALLFFLWGMTNWLILNGADEEARNKGKSLALWSIAAFVLMISIFAIANIVAGALGLDQDTDLDNIPTVPTR